MANLTADPEGAGQPLYSSQATPAHGLGERVVTTDGRVFRYVKNGSVALVGGNWLQGPAQIPNHQTLAPLANVAIGAATFTVTLGATLATANQYAGGWAMVSAGPGIGQMFKILSHPAAALSATLALQLEAGEEVRVALTSAASKIDLIPNQYNGVIQTPITTLTGACVGVAVFPLAANEYGWVQRSGPGCALIAGTPGVGLAIVVPGTAAGAAVIDGAAAATLVVGSMIEVGVDAATRAVLIALE